MGSKLGSLVAALALATAALLVGGTARGAPAAARIIDRTLSCTVPLQSGARPIKVSAHSGFRDPDRPGEWKWLAAAELGLPPVVWVYAGEAPNRASGALALDLARCTRATARVAFSSRGLNGGVASQLLGTDAYDCRVGSRILVRVRAVFREPTSLATVLRAYRQNYRGTPAGAVMREAQLAARTPGGKPVVYADVVESGRARLFVASGCRDD
jgi:hypothetical protein